MSFNKFGLLTFVAAATACVALATLGNENLAMLFGAFALGNTIPAPVKK